MSDEERDSILEAIGTEEALAFKATAERVWQYLRRPPLGHPDEQILWEAEQALEKVTELAQSPEIRNAFAESLKEFGAELSNAARTLLNTEHNVVVVGENGVGKSTALCRIAGLEIHSDGKTIPVLEVGGGGTTVCEARITRGSNYGLYVEPMGEDELHREVMEFATYLTGGVATEPDQEAGEQDAQGTSKEIERLIRNMSGLTVSRRRLSDGKRERIDEARNLAEKLNDANVLAGEIMARIRLPQRTGRRLWYPDLSGKEPLLWLKETFEQLNRGQHPEFSPPKRIDITIQDEILGDESLSICLVDTKGIDIAGGRADLDAHFNEPNTVMVLCSPFNNAPTTELQQQLQMAASGGVVDVGIKAAILALPRPGEAVAVKDDQGIPADSVIDGYELKREQVEMRLSSQNLPYADIGFFNAIEDEPQKTVDFLLDLIRGVRARHRSKLAEVIDGATALVDNFAEAEVQAVYRQAARRVWIWLENNQNIDGLTGSLEGNLIAAISRAHASSVRASVRRQGEWYNLNYSYQMGYGSRVMAARAVVPKLDDFKAITENLLQDEQLEPAFGLVRQAHRILEDGVETLLLRSELLGKRIYIQHLEPDSKFWGRCEGEWGRWFQIDKYRERVARHHRTWFSEHPALQTMVQELVEREWQQILERLAAILDSEATQVLVA